MAHVIGCDNPKDAMVHPIWTYRVLPILALLAILLARAVGTRSVLWSDALLGFASGLLIALCTAAFKARPTQL